jgi:hypothetical protein
MNTTLLAVGAAAAGTSGQDTPVLCNIWWKTTSTRTSTGSKKTCHICPSVNAQDIPYLGVLHEQLQGVMVCVLEEWHPPCKDVVHHHPGTPHVTLLPRTVARHLRRAVAHGAKGMADLRQMNHPKTAEDAFVLPLWQQP